MEIQGVTLSNGSWWNSANIVWCCTCEVYKTSKEFPLAHRSAKTPGLWNVSLFLCAEGNIK